MRPARKPVFPTWLLVLFVVGAVALAVAPAVAPASAQTEPVAPGAGSDRVATAPEDAPEMVSPPDGATTTGESEPPVGVPVLQWLPVTGATKYQVQVSASSGFATTVVSAETYATAYAPTTALGDGIYFWRVRAYIPNTWGPYSNPWLFAKDWSAGGTLVPQLLTPAEGSQRASFLPDDFTWTPVSGAGTYRFEISLDPDFPTALYSATTLTTRHTPTTRFGANTYYWRVIPYDRQGNAGVPSATSSFVFDWNVAPRLLAPAANATLQFLPEFSWTAVEAAKQYRLQISTQPDLSSSVTTYLSDHTTYTPEDNLANDKDYFWRVQAVDYHGTNGPWSEIRRFRMQWYFPAQLLTPLNNAVYTSYPFFSWAPIPGAERYQVQIDESTSFARPIADETVYNVTTYAHPRWDNVAIDGDYFWRVRGIDGSGNYTPWSTTRSFRPSYRNSPTPVYPLYYYTPDAANNPVHADRTVSAPLFVWDTAHRYDDATGLTTKSDFYELAVDDDPGFGSPNFQITTAGLAAAPTAAHPFTNLVDGRLYYWRVRAYQAGQFTSGDAVWVTRIDRRLDEPAPATEVAPMYPADGFEASGAPPVLGWLPHVAGGPYQVQISTDAAFSTVVDEASAEYNHYAPWQGRNTEMPFGAYWWRVRRPGSGWSEARRFNLSVDVIAGNPYDAAPPATSILNSSETYVPALSYIDSSPAEADAGIHDLQALHVMLNRTEWAEHPASYNLNWVIAFQSAAKDGDQLWYGIYLDVDHIVGEGATSDPQGRAITTSPELRPEYALYIYRAATVSPANATFYRWNGVGWDPGQTLTDIGGDVWTDASKNAVQVLLPYAAAGSADTDSAGSLAVTVFTAGAGDAGGARDTIPEQPAGALNRAALVSDMLLPLYPFDTALSNPITLYDMPTLRWRMPYADSVDGYQVEVARDAKFTQVVERWETYEANIWSYFALMPAAFATKNAYEDNESYYWRVRIRHERYVYVPSTFYDYGPWSPPMRFKLDSRQPGNPSLSTGNPAETTPTFSWLRVEGAAGYSVQVDNDANFSSPVINKKIDGASYTPLDALADGTYYWRVAMRRSGTVIGHWSTPQEFTKRSLAPELTAPLADQQVAGLPNFAWKPFLTPAGEPKLAAPRYRLQLSTDPNFGTVRSYDTSATSYTPVRMQSLDDGTWNWRVGIIDANGKVGTYSAPRRLYKEYRSPNLIRPAQGQALGGMPLFEWEAVPGAAYYNIQVANNELFNLPTSVNTDNTRYVATLKLTSSGYYWRVRIIDADGKPGPYKVGRAFLTATLYLPILLK